MYSHDGISGNWDPAGVHWSNVEPALDDPERLRKLAAGPRASVLVFELMTAIGFDASADDRADLYVHGWEKPLISITRPSLETLAEQLKAVNDYADLRPDRLAEIHMQTMDILSFFGALEYLSTDRAKWTLELLRTALRFADLVAMRFKHALGCPRPVQFSQQIQPVIQTPGHTTLPSGHATEAFIVATVLTHLVGGAATVTTERLASEPFRLAARIAINRTVAGVHFPVDSAAGAVLGITLGELLVAWSRPVPKEGEDVNRTINARHLVGNNHTGDFNASILLKLLEDCAKQANRQEAAKPIPLLGTLWSLAQDEVDAQWT